MGTWHAGTWGTWTHRTCEPCGVMLTRKHMGKTDPQDMLTRGTHGHAGHVDTWDMLTHGPLGHIPANGGLCS